MEMDNQNKNQKINIFDLFPENENVEVIPPTEGLDPFINTPLCYNGVSELDLMAM